MNIWGLRRKVKPSVFVITTSENDRCWIFLWCMKSNQVVTFIQVAATFLQINRHFTRKKAYRLGHRYTASTLCFMLTFWTTNLYHFDKASSCLWNKLVFLFWQPRFSDPHSSPLFVDVISSLLFFTSLIIHYFFFTLSIFILGSKLTCSRNLFHLRLDFGPGNGSPMATNVVFVVVLVLLAVVIRFAIC